jgi:hypothetical protein
MERRADPGDERDAAPPEDRRRQGRQEQNRQRPESRVGDLGERDAAGIAERRRDQEDRVPGRAEVERLGLARVVARVKELVGGEQIGARVAEPESLETDVADRRQANGKRDEKEDDRRPAAQRRDRSF